MEKDVAVLPLLWWFKKKKAWLTVTEAVIGVE